MGNGTELRARCRQHHALRCLLASLRPWQHRDSHLAPADTEERRREPATPRLRAAPPVMRSAGSAGRHNPGRGREGGDGPADACAHLHRGSGTTAQGASAALLQHANQLGNLLLITQGQISHSACDAITNFRAGLRRGRKSCLCKGRYASSWHWCVFIPLVQCSHRASILGVEKPHL